MKSCGKRKYGLLHFCCWWRLTTREEGIWTLHAENMHTLFLWSSFWGEVRFKMNYVRIHIEVFNCLVLDLLLTGKYEERYWNRWILYLTRGFYIIPMTTLGPGVHSKLGSSSSDSKPIKQLTISYVKIPFYHHYFDKLLCGHFIRIRHLSISCHKGKSPLLWWPGLSPCWSEAPFGGHTISSGSSQVHISTLVPKLTEICEELHA